MRVRRRGSAAWILTAGLLLQPLVTYLATPQQVVVDRSGHHQLLCTLTGLRLIDLDDPRTPLAPDRDDPCPALKMVQLAATAQPVAASRPTPVVLRFVTVVEAMIADHHPFRPPRSYPIRAPPMS